MSRKASIRQVSSRHASGRNTARGRGRKRKASRRSEALGIVVLLLGFVLLLSLISYSPTDPPAFDSATARPRNLMGQVGALLAYGMVGKLGRIPPLLTIFVILMWGWRFLRSTVNRSLLTTSLKILAVQLLLSILLAFPHFLISTEISYNLAGEWGGQAAGFLVTKVGIGAPLVWLALLLLFLMAAFGLKPGEIAGAAVSAGRTAGNAVAGLLGSFAPVSDRIADAFGSLTSRIRRRKAPKEPTPALSPPSGEAGDISAVDPDSSITSGVPAAFEVSAAEEAPAAAVVGVSGSVGSGADAPAGTDGSAGRPEPIEVLPARSRPPGKQRTKRASGASKSAGAFDLPSFDIFSLPAADERGPAEDEVRQEAELLQEKLLSFGVKAEVTGWQTGPIITRFEIAPAPGVKVNQILNLADDLALAMRAKRIRIVAPIPGKAAVGVEIPNHAPRIVRLREVLESEAFTNVGLKIPMAIGMDIGGSAFVADLAGMPHLLLAGTTGSGKSVSINAIIASILLRMSPEECRFIMVDPKMLELAIYNSIPHLITPVVTNPKKALDALRWAGATVRPAGRGDGP